MRPSFLLLTAVLLAGASCGKYEGGPCEALPDGIPVNFAMTLVNPEARSSFCPASLDMVSDVNVWVYQEGVLLPAYSFHRSMTSGMETEVLFPSARAVYDVYFLANMGQVSGPALEEDIADAAAGIDSYSSFSERGFPMAGAVYGFSPSGNGRVTLSRLVGRIDICAYENPSNTRISYTFLSGKMKACARVIRPFGEMAGEQGFASRAESENEVLDEGDSLSEADIAALNSGGTVTLYYLENRQGLLLPGNSEQHGKSAGAIEAATGDPSLPQLCSYLELTCSATTPTATYSSVVYRAYLGRDATSDFSIVRNSVHSLTLDLASEAINAEDWFVEPGTPEITGRLCFTDTRYTPLSAPSGFQSNTDDDEYRRPFRDVRSIFLSKGFSALYYIYRSDPRTRYSVRLDSDPALSPFVSCQISWVDGNFAAILISTARTPDGSSLEYGSGPYGDVLHRFDPHYNFFGNPSQGETENVNLIIESYDGLLRDTLTVRVLTKLPAALLDYRSDTGKLLIRYSNPLGLKLYTYVSGSIQGSVSYKPNGTAFSSKTAERTVSFTRTWQAFQGRYGYSEVCPEISYRDNSSSVSTSAGTVSAFSGCFDCVWSLTGWDSYTTLNGSNGYNKHAHPTAMELKMQLRYDTPQIYRLLPDHGVKLPFCMANHEGKAFSPSDSSESVALTGSDIGFSYSCAAKAGSSATTYTFPKSKSILSVMNDAYSLGDYTLFWVSERLKITEFTDWAPSGHYPEDSWLSSLGFDADRQGNIGAVSVTGTVVE
ncbi:MAG: DUF4906 domain-containing protein [Bacteroidales bacterium]|nr:DUF4906 domain-containing protein [Bacteroidales bacterium]